MAQYAEQLNVTFQALADPTRRSVLARLGQGAATVSDLSEPFDMALPSFMKHIRLLEKSGWIRTRKKGRVRTCEIEEARIEEIETWISAQKEIWEGRADRLEQFVTDKEKPQ